jgi:phage gp36-like protein
MSYITNADIETRLGTAAYVELTDDDGTGSADLAKVDEARLGAEGEANSYLATPYAVPVIIASDPEAASVLRTFVLDLAAYRLHCRRPPVPADVVRRREEAVTWLGRVASGVVQLPAATAPRANPALGLVAQTSGPPRALTRESLGDL